MCAHTCEGMNNERVGEKQVTRDLYVVLGYKQSSFLNQEGWVTTEGL